MRPASLSTCNSCWNTDTDCSIREWQSWQEDQLSPGFREDAADHGVSRCLVHAALVVGPRIDPDHMAGWRDIALQAQQRVTDGQPRVVDRAIFAVVAVAKVLNRLDVQPFVGVEHGEAVAVPLGITLSENDEDEVWTGSR